VLARGGGTLDNLTDEFFFLLVRNNVHGDSIIFGSAIAIEPGVYRFVLYHAKTFMNTNVRVCVCLLMKYQLVLFISWSWSTTNIVIETVIYSIRTF